MEDLQGNVILGSFPKTPPTPLGGGLVGELNH